jgi:hypothetical protein
MGVGMVVSSPGSCALDCAPACLDIAEEPRLATANSPNARRFIAQSPQLDFVALDAVVFSGPFGELMLIKRSACHKKCQPDSALPMIFSPFITPSSRIYI